MTQNKKFVPNGYSHGENTNNALGHLTNDSPVPLPIPFFFHKVACGYQTSAFLVSDKHNEGCYNTILYNHSTKKEFKMAKEVKSISAGCYHILFQTVDNEVYGFGRSTRGQLGKANETIDTPTKLEFFKGKPFHVKKALCGGDSSYFLCSNNDLYFVGMTKFGTFSESFQTNKDSIIPVLISTDVDDFYVGVYGFHMFFRKTNDSKLYARGNGKHGQLGLGTKLCHVSENKPCPEIDSSEIVTMSLGHEYSCLVLNKQTNNSNTVYGCGSTHNGSGTESSYWLILKELNDKNVVEIESGCWHTIARTSTNEFYVWGNCGNSLLFEKTNKNQIKPKKVVFNKLNQALEEEYAGYSYKIECGLYQTFIYLTQDDNNILVKDICRSFDQKENNFKDLEILKNKLSVHKVFVEKRLKLKTEKILKIITEKINNEESIINFFRLVYNKQIQNKNSLNHIFDLFSLDMNSFIKYQTLENDLYELYKDDDSKDFEIIVVEDQDDDDEEEEEEEEEDQFERIPVHKFILAARSGLFREMFENVTNKKEMIEIKDYSGKTPESIEILIKYFYTNKIELTADDDPQLIVEELSDAVEYYQLNKKSNLNIELNKIKKQFNIK
ncbi:claret [Anaeramoeba flamelloides]|uniref:Claret n=1 Tax=Anaeramoeba flamelloides TaxID=1746091 RepID=A0ABQ8Y2X6_9EUKA|nr:claret [Anaeramoeba flamelloides]